jgi:hypothetical protein
MRFLFIMLPALLLCAPVIAGDRLDPSDPDDRMRLTIKLNCSLESGVPVVYWWAGRMYSRVQGERDRHLFDVQGMNIRQCETRLDPVRGVCYRSISREVLFYIDPATGEVARRWKNPWTGQEVEVLQVANDPPGRTDTCSRDEQGKPVAAPGGGSFIEKDGWLLTGGGAARLFYPNPMGGDFQEYVGGTYHAMEFLTSAQRADDLLDADAPAVRDRVISWGRVSQWLPWMEMGSRPGVVFFHTAGLRLDSWDEMPELMKKEIDANFPIYREAPPLDYDRPRETSWTVAKDHIDRQRRESGNAP